ncbi:variant erythrocyte surface antigen-1 family protein [Babesia caballi]|uniref:Variant erythrocyte surface antigen-1 family protein n=1 Tax=Babesia caballi TaxID=5871 RepID=A0AAV4M1X0_BABCB|nr:variant erythrocyte surface antigen-1 family protein [Babesia caballi]
MVLYSRMLTPLTDWPEDLKDVIGWFLRVTEMDQGGIGISNSDKLKEAVDKLQDFSTVTSSVGSFDITGLFNNVARALQHLIGYGGNNQLDGQGIGLSNSAGGYASSYKTDATWTWNNDSDPQSKICAHILLGSFPLLYFGLTYLLWQCSANHGWQNQIVGGNGNGSQLHDFMSYMGYNISQLKSDVNGEKIATLLGNEYDSIQDFKTLYNSASTMTYAEFLQKLHQKGAVARSVMDVPFYKLFAAASKYLQSKVKPSKIMELPQTKSEISKTLQGYSEAVKKLEGSNTQQLSKAYNTLLKQIQSVFHPDSPAPPSSSGAAAAGGVLGTAALGTTAALATNVGGITTTLKNLITIFK